MPRYDEISNQLSLSEAYSWKHNVSEEWNIHRFRGRISIYWLIKYITLFKSFVGHQILHYWKSKIEGSRTILLHTGTNSIESTLSSNCLLHFSNSKVNMDEIRSHSSNQTKHILKKKHLNKTVQSNL